MVAVGYFLLLAMTGLGWLLYAAWSFLRIVVILVCWLVMRAVMAVEAISLRRRVL